VEVALEMETFEGMTIPPADLRRLVDRLQVAVVCVQSLRARQREPSADLEALEHAVADAAALVRDWAHRDPDLTA
jgi:hypothetical protein